jgi:hypothetical protein
MPKRFWIHLFLGAATFIAAHAIEVAARIGGDQPWFISELASTIFTTSLICVAGVIVGATSKGFHDWIVSAVSFVVGAAVVMTVTLFTHPKGPGNLFPLALMLGTAFIAFGTFAGAATGQLIRRLMR